MEFLIFMAACLGAIFIFAAIQQISTEVRGVRSVLETQFNLEPVPVRTDENRYKRKGVEL